MENFPQDNTNPRKRLRIKLLWKIITIYLQIIIKVSQGNLEEILWINLGVWIKHKTILKKKKKVFIIFIKFSLYANTLCESLKNINLLDAFLSNFYLNLDSSASGLKYILWNIKYSFW